MVKELLKKTPVIGKLVTRIYRRLKGIPSFTTSKNYWEERYKMGGNSGAGSYNNLAQFKAGIINSFVDKNEISTVIEFGCGDGNQLKYFHFKSFIGYDVSPTAISICTNLFKEDGSKRFDVISNHTNEKADLTLSLDVIYHLIEEETYLEYMKKLFYSSNKFVIVYSSNSNEHENNGVASHVKHRKFTDWIEDKVPQFKLVEHVPNKYPFNGYGSRSSYADFYIFQKQD